MKKLLILFVCFTCSFHALAQDTSKLKVKLDYIVDYALGSEGKKDTIQVAYSKNGRYVWSNFDVFQSVFSKSFSPFGPEKMFMGGKTNIIFDAKTLQLYFHFNNENNAMFMKVDFNDIIPQRYFNTEKQKEIEFISEKLDEEITVLGKSYAVYNIYPTSESNNDLSAVLDKKYPVDNTMLFGNFFTLLMKKMDGDTVSSVDIPKGLILYLRNNTDQILEAIAVKKINRRITINNTLEIKE
ncbi:MAG: hypothetical protein AAF611_18100 [Bacteroidota bacterium]